ncbi:hypothetical protein EVAR_93032_1 [Eumeta japonica]|uniref:Uncharacterized protein n=1 Tax=Eumeta variegata TaxID=151549 RepID=A0A4C1SEX6_EUMVA|nr:hypothetical protein EVAR_93032_1 [Eumeta japonica]
MPAHVHGPSARRRRLPLSGTHFEPWLSHRIMSASLAARSPSSCRRKLVRVNVVSRFNCSLILVVVDFDALDAKERIGN